MLCDRACWFIGSQARFGQDVFDNGRNWFLKIDFDFDSLPVEEVDLDTLDEEVGDCIRSFKTSVFTSVAGQGRVDDRGKLKRHWKRAA